MTPTAPPPDGCEVAVGGERVRLLAERAVWWPATHTLLVADLHWGKCATFHDHGVPVPGTLLGDDLDRLRRLLRMTAAQRCVVLGDLIHGRLGLTTEVIESVRSMLQTSEVPFVLVDGNHDRGELPAAWRPFLIRQRGTLCDGPFAFTHEPRAVAGRYAWAGHLHPTVRLRDGGTRLRLPCFALGDDHAVLPAFAQFTRGLLITPASGFRNVFAIADRAVVELPACGHGRRRESLDD